MTLGEEKARGRGRKKHVAGSAQTTQKVPLHSPEPMSGVVESSTVNRSPGRSPRKFRAVRSPIKPEVQVREAQDPAPELVVDTPPWVAGTRKRDGASRTELYSLVNDRYPGAPGTALAHAGEEKARSASAQRRESNRKSAAKAEWDRLGLKNLAKKRKSSSPYASEAGSTAGSDTESSAPPSRGSRTRRISSRQSTPVHLTAEQEIRVPSSYNAPVHPSPLASNFVLSQDPER